MANNNFYTQNFTKLKLLTNPKSKCQFIKLLKKISMQLDYGQIDEKFAQAKIDGFIGNCLNQRLVFDENIKE